MDLNDMATDFNKKMLAEHKNSEALTKKRVSLLNEMLEAVNASLEEVNKGLSSTVVISTEEECYFDSIHSVPRIKLNVRAYNKKDEELLYRVLDFKVKGDSNFETLVDVLYPYNNEEGVLDCKLSEQHLSVEEALGKFLTELQIVLLKDCRQKTAHACNKKFKY